MLQFYILVSIHRQSRSEETISNRLSKDVHVDFSLKFINFYALKIYIY
jgi:hypothetical protein